MKKVTIEKSKQTAGYVVIHEDAAGNLAHDFFATQSAAEDFARDFYGVELRYVARAVNGQIQAHAESVEPPKQHIHISDEEIIARLQTW